MVDFVYERKPKLWLPVRVVLLYLTSFFSLFLFVYTLATNYPTVTKEGDYTEDDITYAEFTFLYAKSRKRSRDLVYLYDYDKNSKVAVFAGGWHLRLSQKRTFFGGYINYYEGLEELPYFVHVEQKGNIITPESSGLARLNDRKLWLINQLKLFAIIFIATLLLSPFVVGKKLFHKIIQHLRS